MKTSQRLHLIHEIAKRILILTVSVPMLMGFNGNNSIRINDTIQPIKYP